LPALLGPGRARDLILTGRRIAAPEAYFLGLADRLVEVVPGAEESVDEVAKRARETVLTEAVALAMDICEGGPVAVRQALKAVDGWQDGGVSEGKAYEVVLNTEDRNEALKAFKEKRKPIYKGR
jgi:methylglutaconyl-CoA hydratase